MFGRKPSTAVGESSRLRGDLDCGDDELVVAGVIEGTIESNATVTVVEGGAVIGDVTAVVVIVGGRIEGRVIARERLAMRPTGRIQGDACYGSLEVERGGVIEGRASALHESLKEALHERPPPILEGAKVSPVEETMRFTTPLAVGDLEGDGERPVGVTAPTRAAPPASPRATDPWGALEPPEDALDEESVETEGPGGDELSRPASSGSASDPDRRTTR